MMRGLAGRVVLVSGAASGIGRATAERLAAEGAAVALVDRDARLLDEVAAGLGPARVLPLVADVSRTDEVRGAVERTVAALGGLDGVVTCAGIFDPGDMRPLADVELESFARVLDVHADECQ